MTIATAAPSRRDTQIAAFRSLLTTLALLPPLLPLHSPFKKASAASPPSPSSPRHAALDGAAPVDNVVDNVAALAAAAAAAAAADTNAASGNGRDAGAYVDAYADAAADADADAETHRIALSLYDHYLEGLEDMADGDHRSAGSADPIAALTMAHDGAAAMAAADPSERIKFLIKTMAALDPNDELRHWILDHPMELDEDADDNVPESLAGRRVNGSRAAFCRVMAQVAFALGSTLASEGNPRHGYHMMTCAVTIYEIIARAAQRTRQDKLSDTHAYLVFYREIAQIASLAGDADHAVLYATKLVALHDVAVAESLNDDSSAMRSSSPTTPQIDLASRLSAQLLLADVAVKGLHFGTAVHAYTRALQLFDLQESLLLELADVNDEMTDFKRQRQATRKDICLRLVDANEDAKGDALISLTYARRACEISTSSPGSDSGVSTNEDDVRLVFRTGVLVYKYVLQIAGGIDHASSPPVAAILDATVTAAGQKGPSIRTLLEEAVQLLEDARSDATADVSDPNSKRAIGLQLAILFTEIRDEDKARELLREYSFNNSNLQDLDQHRRRSRSHQPGEGYSPSMIAPFANVVYSPEAFKRLVSIAPVYEAKGSLPSAARLTLSRGRRSTFLGASPVATKVPCAYCSMIFTSDDPLKCEDCAAQRVFVYYCCDECMSQHQPQHEPDCAKTRPLSAAQDFTLTATLSSLLSN